MEAREILVRFILPDDPDLARRVNALLWAYERGRLRQRVCHEPLCRVLPAAIQSAGSIRSNAPLRSSVIT